MLNYQLDRIRAYRQESRPAVWTFAKKNVSGTEHKYRVEDGNFPSRNDWTFVVRVPRNTRDRIEVRPIDVPNLAVWADLARRSLTFARATRHGYTKRRYCPIALADVTGEKTKQTVGRSDRGLLPPWFRQMEGRIRVKETVRPTRGTDGDKLVILVGLDDHEEMIRCFFPTKVWPLKEARGLSKARGGGAGRGAVRGASPPAGSSRRTAR